MTNLVIQLEPNQHGRFVFPPNHVLKGTVELQLESQKKFRGMHVTIHGFARAHWTEQRTRSTGSGKNRRTTTYTVYYEGREVYLNSKTYLFGSYGAESQNIEAGVYRYNFGCQLPDGLPSSMGAVHGDIEYYVEAVLDIPWRFDKEFKFPFTVIRCDDLNLYPELRLGQKMEDVKNFCCLFCESGPLYISASIPFSGFAIGQKIHVRIECSNKSNVDVEYTRVKLKRLISFTSHTPEVKTKTEKETMVEKVIERVIKENQNVHMECDIEIPSILMNSNGRFCRVIQIEYYIAVEAVVGGCHTNPEIRLPLTIGSVPLNLDTGYNQLQEGYPQPAPYPQPMAQYPTAPPSIQPSAPADENKTDLPPSFEEAMSMPKPQTSTAEASGSLGWNVLEPSVPQEKEKI